LLPLSNQEQVPFAYTMYKNSTKKGYLQSEGFKRTFSREVSIEFVGVWVCANCSFLEFLLSKCLFQDTVSSVGIIVPRHLPFTGSNVIIKNFRHALAIDERRSKFSANVWHRSLKEDSFAKRDPEHASQAPIDIGTMKAYADYKETNVEEVWFPGCHSGRSQSY